MLALPSLWLALAADPFLADIPLQGALVDADGAAPSGSRTVQFTITGESGPIWSGVKVVHLDRGLFSAMLEGVDLTRFRYARAETDRQMAQVETGALAAAQQRE